MIQNGPIEVYDSISQFRHALHVASVREDALCKVR